MTHIPLKDRKAWLFSLPFITRKRNPERCVEYKWSHVPLAMIYSEDDDRRAALREKYRCKKLGHYNFKALKPRKNDWGSEVGKSGAYCWEHLMNQVNYRPRERRRLDRYLEKNPPYWFKQEEGNGEEEPGRSGQQRGSGEEPRSE